MKCDEVYIVNTVLYKSYFILLIKQNIEMSFSAEIFTSKIVSNSAITTVELYELIFSHNFAHQLKV